MNTILRLLVFWIAAIAAAQTSQSSVAIGYKALIVGNSTYPAAPLKNPVNDAQSLAERLTVLGFTATVSYDASLKELDKQVAHFAQQIEKNDVVLFYYSGHGFQSDGENYLIPIDYNAAALSDIEAKYQSFSLSRIIDTISAKNPRFTIIILDACRTGLPTGSRSVKAGWAAINGVTGSFVAFATKPGQTASDNPTGPNGLFTQELLKYLGRQDLTLDELFNRVRSDVYQESGGHQIPSVESALLNAFSFKTLPIAALPLDTLSHTALSNEMSPSDTRGLNVASERSLGRAPRTERDSVEGKRLAGISEVQDRDSVPSLLRRLLASLELGDFSSALRDSERVLSFEPTNQDAHKGRGRALMLSGLYDKAIEELSTCLVQNANDVVAMYYRSVAFTGQGDLLSAWEDATAAIVRAPSYADAYVSRSIVLLAGGRFKDAIDDATQALKYEPDLPLAYIIRGHAFRAMGQTGAAERDFSTSSLRIRRDTVTGSVSHSSERAH